MPVMSFSVCDSSKKRCKYTQKPGAMQIYLHWHSDMFTCFEACFVNHSTQFLSRGNQNFEGSATDSWVFGSLSGKDRAGMD